MWEPGRPGVTWDERRLAAPSLNPAYWCTVCATQAEADAIAEGLLREIRRAGS